MMQYQNSNFHESAPIKWMNYDEISDSIKKSIIAAEDDNFLDHSGIDWINLRIAVRENYKAKKIIRGGSTISQQVVKNLFLTPKKNYFRKFNEFILAVILELIMTKKRIFEIYLNIIEWGEGVYGISNAIKYYYGYDSSKLSDYEAAKLASMINKPKFYQKNFYSDELNLKTIKIMNRMNYSNFP